MFAKVVSSHSVAKLPALAVMEQEAVRFNAAPTEALPEAVGAKLLAMV